ncbi:hypothetical protein C7E23_17915 [Elizabethkingia anophelis]|nr:hypothetical protein C7E23_17915 [Elizabethkingia anophelis]
MGRQDYLKKYTNESKAKSPEISGIPRRDREPNIKYIKIGSLKSIQYPTGAKKKFFIMSFRLVLLIIMEEEELIIMQLVASKLQESTEVLLLQLCTKILY